MWSYQANQRSFDGPVQVEMATRTVYCFYFYQPGSGKLVHSPKAATLERIEQMDGVPLRDTGLDVDSEYIDANGFFRGKPHCSHPTHR